MHRHRAAPGSHGGRGPAPVQGLTAAPLAYGHSRCPPASRTALAVRSASKKNTVNVSYLNGIPEDSAVTGI